MDRILEYAAGDLVVRVEAGVRLGQLAEVLAEKGQRLALDGPPADTVGGVVARNAAGPLRLRYGLPRDLLIGLTIVRADGHVARAGGKVVKNVAGYDLGKLFAGSHGTLGLIVEATFRLHPVPELSAYVTEEYAASAAAAEAVLAAAASPLQPSAVELERPRPGGPIRVATLLEGTPSGVSARAERMRTALGRGATSTLAAPDWWGRIGEAPPAGTTRPGCGGGRDAGAGGVLGRGTAPGAGRDRHRGHQHRGGGGGERLGRGRRAVRAAARGRRRRAGRGVRAGAAGRDRPWCQWARTGRRRAGPGQRGRADRARRGAGPGRPVGAGPIAGADAGGQAAVRSAGPDVPRTRAEEESEWTTAELRDLAGDCVHCGFCLPACPTYSLWGEEMDSPRGRIHLVTQVLDGEELSTAAAEHFDRCLGCMACMTACPSGVQYDRLIEAAWAWTDDPEHAPPVQPEAHLHEVAGADGA